MNIEPQADPAAPETSAAEPAKKATKKKAAAAVPLILSPGYYLFHPHEGVSVITGKYDMPTAGFMVTVVEMRPLHDHKNIKLSPPVGRLKELGIRAVGGAESLLRALKEFEKKPAGRSNELWSLRAQKYHDQLRSGDSVQNAALIHKILSKYRVLDFKPENIGKDIPSIDAMSYSEREIAQKAINLLAGEISYVSGKTYQESQRLLLCCALVEGFAKGVKLDIQKHPRMSDAEFQFMFGMTLQDAAAGKEAVVPIGTPKVHNPSAYVARSSLEESPVRHGRFTGASVQGRVTKEKLAGKKRPELLGPSTPAKKQKPEKQPKERRVKAIAVKMSFEDGLTTAMREIFVQENQYLDKKGFRRGCALKAAQILSPEEFSVYSKLLLRLKEHQLSIAEVAAQSGRSEQEIITIRNLCAEAMRMALNPEGKFAVYSLFQPYQPTVEETPKEEQAAPEEDAVPTEDVSPEPEPTPAPEPEPEPVPDNSAAEAAAERTKKLNAVYEGEREKVSTNIVLFMLFEQARDILDPEEMLIHTRTDLRQVKLRDSFEQVAKKLHIPVETALEIRNRAAAKLKERAVLEEDGFYESPALRPRALEA